MNELIEYIKHPDFILNIMPYVVYAMIAILIAVIFIDIVILGNIDNY